MKLCGICHKRFDDSEETCPTDGSPLLQIPEENLVGKVIDGRYNILSRLGEGGMGSVFRAIQFSVNREVALKVIRREFTENEALIKRFLREATATSRLRSPNTVTVYDSGQTKDGLLYLVMELVRGSTLKDLLLREGRFSVDRTLHLLQQVCSSLMEAHAESIVHRDLKPANLMIEDRVGQKDFLTVLDFGIAYVGRPDDEEPLTHTGLLIGSPAYMSPEQIQSSSMDRRSDIYSLGVIAYEILCGHCPFVDESFTSLFRRHCFETPPSIRQAHPELPIPPALDRLILRCLSKKPGDRPYDAETFRGEIDSLRAINTTGSRVSGIGATRPERLGGEEGNALETRTTDDPFPSRTPADSAETLDADSREGAALLRSQTGAPPTTPDPVGPSTRARRKFIVVVSVVLAALLGATLVVALHQGWWSEQSSIPSISPPSLLPPAALLVVFPFHGEPERTVDVQIWPLLDRVVVNSLVNSREALGLLRLVDPLDVEAQMRAREIHPPLSGEEAHEVARALGADVMVTGEVTRREGRVVLDVQWAGVGEGASGRLKAEGMDVFDAAKYLMPALLDAMPLQKQRSEGSPTPPLSDAILAPWGELLGNPWSEGRYITLLGIFRGQPDESLVQFASALVGQRGPTNACLPYSAAVQRAHPDRIGPLASAVCRFRRLEYEDALRDAEKASSSLHVREAAFRFITKMQGRVRNPKARMEFLERRVRLFPDSYQAWWLLALEYSSQKRPVALASAVKTAEYLSLGKEMGFKGALSAVRVYMQLEDFYKADSWMDALERTDAESPWDILWRAGRKSALCQLRGRFSDAQRVWEEALRELRKQPGDPYTIAATALFYSYLTFGDFDRAAEIVREYLGFFEGTGKPDIWTGRLLEIALDTAKGTVGEDLLVAEAERIGQAIVDQIGEAGTRERDGFVCQLLAHLASPDVVRSLVLKAAPENTMIGCCRIRAAQALLAEGRHRDARALFTKARRDLLYRSDWCLELYPAALLGEAQAAEAEGDKDGALRLYKTLTTQYREAEMDLNEVQMAAEAAERLSRTTHPR